MAESPEEALAGLLGRGWDLEELRRLARYTDRELASAVSGESVAAYAYDLAVRACARSVVPSLLDRMLTERERLGAEIGALRLQFGLGPPRTDRIGPYLLLERLGEGTVAAVHRARHTVLGVEHALKVLKPGADPTTRERFVDEARVLGALDHPNLPRVHGADEGETPWIALELAPGGTLAEQVRGGGLDVRRAVERILEVLDALTALHAAGWIHRDVKPQNLLLGEGDRVKLCDLGSARNPARAGRTQVGLGTPGYWAPEQRRAGKAIGPATDVYAAAATLVALVTGELERDELDHPEVFDEATANLDPGLVTILRRALARKPEARHPDAPALAAELRAWSGPPPRRERPVGVRLLDGALGTALDAAREREIGRAGWEELRIGVLLWVERCLATGDGPRPALLAAQAELLIDLAEGSTRGAGRDLARHQYLADAIAAASEAEAGLTGEARAWAWMLEGVAWREQTTGREAENREKARARLDAAVAALPAGSVEWARGVVERAEVETQAGAPEGAKWADEADRAAVVFERAGCEGWRRWAESTAVRCAAQTGADVVERLARLTTAWPEAENPLRAGAVAHLQGWIESRRKGPQRNLHLAQGIAHFERALRLRTRERSPFRWAGSTFNVAWCTAERTDGDRDAHLARAADLFLLALQVWTLAQTPEKWADTTQNLARSLTMRRDGDREERLARAVSLHDAVLSASDPPTDRRRWRSSQWNRAWALAERGETTGRADLEAALAGFRAALSAYEPGTPDHTTLTANIAAVEKKLAHLW